ncbi:hypothetical protein A9CBEGH2_07960 [Amedibacterium intestinale]|uniref:hypothetical protein n=1 Tax=Amedibacterium intestinale TaxID=2583452 RepID=UPI001373E986|nr:hypothetical protein [Amedibacterium intestinale]BBK61856.1 hypothetical protein A9CBEGH2_07960 [Amedibacterium intestinale]
MAKYLDQTGVSTLWAKIKEKFVLKDGSKVLSTNDYTTAEKQKLGGIATGAQVNVIEKVSVNGSALTPSSKGVNITVPTKVSQVTNDSGYQTASQVSSAISSAISGISGFKYEVVSALPSSGKDGTIYLKANSGAGQNIYDEFIWVNSKWEQLGTKQIDLSGYMKKTDMVALTEGEIDAICV